MGQYFILVNLDKKEYVKAWDIEGVAKLFEWCTNPQAGIIPFLLAQGPDDGVSGSGQRYRKEKETGKPQTHPAWGRWSGDRITLVGDYDESGLYDETESGFTNVSETVLKEFNDFVGEKFSLGNVELRGLRPDFVLQAD